MDMQAGWAKMRLCSGCRDLKTVSTVNSMQLLINRGKGKGKLRRVKEDSRWVTG